MLSHGDPWCVLGGGIGAKDQQDRCPRQAGAGHAREETGLCSTRPLLADSPHAPGHKHSPLPEHGRTIRPRPAAPQSSQSRALVAQASICLAQVCTCYNTPRVRATCYNTPRVRASAVSPCLVAQVSICLGDALPGACLSAAALAGRYQDRVGASSAWLLACALGVL